MEDNNEKLLGEVWKRSSEAKQFEVSNFGRVRYTRTKKILIGSVHDGYIRVSHKLVHRLVAKEFIPNPDNKPCVNHINGDKINNHVDNLQWCTIEENTKHAIEVLGAIERKLTIEQAEQLRKDVANYKYKSIREISKKFKMNRDCISSILDNKTYKTKTSKPVNIFKRSHMAEINEQKAIKEEWRNKMLNKNIIGAIQTHFLIEMTKVVTQLSKEYKIDSDTVLNIITQNLPSIPQQNSNNRPSNNTSGYRNITRFRTNRWRAIITDGDKRKCLGNRFKTQKEALDVLNNYIIKHNLPKANLQEYYGELVILNKEQEMAQKLYEEQNWNRHILLNSKQNDF